MDVMSGDQRIISDTFDERAANYGKGNWHRVYAERLVDLAGLRPGQAILDAGAGTGFAAIAIARLRRSPRPASAVSRSSPSTSTSPTPISHVPGTRIRVHPRTPRCAS